jgi:hypothetical protein
MDIFSSEGQDKWYLLERGLHYTKAIINGSFITDLLPVKILKNDFLSRHINRNLWVMLFIPESEIQLNLKLIQFIPAYQ